MAFDKFDHLRGMGRQYERLARGLNQYERIMRPYERMLESHRRTMASVESPLMRDVQAATAAAGTLHSHIQTMADAVKPMSGLQQMVADRVKSIDVAETWGMKDLAARVALPSSNVGGFQNLVSKIVEQQQQPFHSLVNTMVEQKLRPLQTLAQSVAAAGLPREVTRDAWRPVLMRGFEAPSFSAISQIATAVDAHNGNLAKTILRGMTPAMDAVQESQARQAQDIIRAINAAAGPSSALQQWSAIDKSYRLWGAWVAPVLPERRTPAYRPPTTEPEPFTSFPPAEAPPTETPLAEVLSDEAPPAAEQGAERAPAPEDCPRQLTGRWELLQPVENTLHGIICGPLIVTAASKALTHMRSWKHESLLRRPQTQDSRRPQARHP